jgi:hypothetical protein
MSVSEQTFTSRPELQSSPRSFRSLNEKSSDIENGSTSRNTATTPDEMRTSARSPHSVTLITRSQDDPTNPRLVLNRIQIPEPQFPKNYYGHRPLKRNGSTAENHEKKVPKLSLKIKNWPQTEETAAEILTTMRENAKNREQSANSAATLSLIPSPPVKSCT